MSPFQGNITAQNVQCQLSPLEERIFSRVYLRCPLPSQFQAVDIILSDADFAVIRNCPAIVWNKIKQALGSLDVVDDFAIFQLIRTNKLDAFVLNYFLDSLFEPGKETDPICFFKTIRMMHVLYKTVKEFPGYGGKNC